MDRTYGTVTIDDTGDRRRWVIDADPHVMMRLKRIFPRVLSNRRGEIRLRDTPEIAHDIAWILERWPMVLAPTVADYLATADKGYVQQREMVEKILHGYQPPLALQEPVCEMREYQLTAANMVLTSGHLLLADDVGVGKTHSSLLVLRDPAALPAVVVTLAHLPMQWKKMLETTLPWLRGHIAKTTKPHDFDADVLILNYHKLAGWADYLAGRVQTTIFDEVQELRHQGTQKYNSATQIAFAGSYAMGLTATPIYNYGDEVWSIMNVLAPDVLGDRSEFVREWCSDERSVSDPAALGLYLRDQGVMLRRTRKDVGREIPPVQRLPHPVDIDLTELDHLASDAAVLAERILSTDAGQREVFLAAGDFDWKLRHATGVAKARHVAAFTRMILETGEPMVLFGWHRDVYDIWAHELADFNPAFYTGSERTAAAKADSAERFISGDTNLLIMSLRAGAGLDGLQERAHIAVFGELDWSPGVHHQCIGRLWRDGQDEPVVAYFLVSTDGADPAMAEVLDLKRQQSEPFVDPQLPLFEAATAPPGDRIKALATEYLARKKARHG